MIWEIVEKDKNGNERVIKRVNSKPVAERAVHMRRDVLSMRGRLDEVEVSIRKAAAKETNKPRAQNFNAR